MIDLYTWSTPNGRKVSILLEEIELKYRTIPINITTGEQNDSNFIKINPNKKIPVIVDRDNGLNLFESGAILLYLANKKKKFIPKGKYYWKMMQWLIWQNASLGPMLGQAHHFLHDNPTRSNYSNIRYFNETKKLYNLLENHLNKNDFLVNEYSLADIAIWPWIARFKRHKIQLIDYPNIKKWYLNISRRKAVMEGFNLPGFNEKIPIP